MEGAKKKEEKERKRETEKEWKEGGYGRSRGGRCVSFVSRDFHPWRSHDVVFFFFSGLQPTLPFPFDGGLVPGAEGGGSKNVPCRSG